ncbi:DUF927 domain-containing protein [Pantoea sp.]|uniref:DUF927 domain-containing protein n=1 Tax=Pantoea sp. TaxID=69393 RepID=UPI0028AF22B7|nr:DUF927 domain-containing protein [Pantoea sp.]
MAKKKALPVRLLALSEKEDGQVAYRLIKVKDCHSGKWILVLIPAHIITDKKKLRETLIDAGLGLDYSERDFNQIIDHLKTVPKDRVKLCMRPGFVNVDGSLCYLTGSGQVLGNVEGCAPMPYPNAPAFKGCENQKGTLKQWQMHVASAALHSPYAMLTVCSAMAGYCIYFTNFESGGFHLYGDSSKGKTTALLVAASVFGSNQYVCDWNVTETAFEEFAESRNNSLLILDELVLLDKNPKEAAQKMQKLVYILGSGGGKQRSTHYQKHKAVWRLNAISNGENGLAQHAADGDMSRKKGEQARFVDVPVDCGNDQGIFLTVPEDMTLSDYAETIKENCERYHGTAGPALVNKLLEKKSEFLTEKIDRYSREFLKHHKIEGQDGLEKRIARRFALAYASGVIAVKCKILPFSPQEVMKGISCCYMMACDKKPQTKEVFNQILKDALKNEACPLPVGVWDIEKLNEVNVFVTTIDEVEVLAVKADFFKKNIIGNLSQVTDWLTKNGSLFVDASGKATRQLRRGKSYTKRRYCLKMHNWK